ncbi:ABC transporter substrate-binding protein [Bordetella genomosp. 9]|uniref:ABC transporter substrate-binding protein n=1 Tax=Bordetella genomosp. 9 TaxID=1416803 RepID=A0A261RE11_9BORD|nr:tripartite tricarboxylate transporter substrate binding protein [Bordetella genomosp. 9]OZI23266.1 ABC transporter substrate-binding protein [Bordetella genomosp. 9]
MKKILGVCLAALAGYGFSAQADTFPSRPVTLVVPLAAGSTADILARAIQPGLSERLGQSVVVENKAGGSGLIAMNYVARSAPDGYTLVMGSNNTWAINLGLYKTMPYDPQKDFAPVAYLAGGSNVLIVKQGGKYDSVKALIDAMRQHPGRLTFSSGGNGTTHHLSAENLKALTDTNATHIPYRGAPQGVTAVMAGEVDFGFYNTPSVSGLVKEGKVKALATTGEARSPLLPEIPTMIEAGVPGYVISVDFGLLAPAHTPQAVIDRLNETTRAVMNDPKLQERLKALGYEVFRDETPTQFARFIQQDIDKWVPLVKRSGATID